MLSASKTVASHARRISLRNARPSSSSSITRTVSPEKSRICFKAQERTAPRAGTTACSDAIKKEVDRTIDEGARERRLRLFCGVPPRVTLGYPCIPKAVVRFGRTGSCVQTKTTQEFPGHRIPSGLE